MFEIDAANPMPLYAQLERAIRLKIATGLLRPGDQLPTVRQLAVDLRINANTVARVYGELERAGVVETRRGIGTFVSSAPNAVSALPPELGQGKAESDRERDRLLASCCGRFLAEASALGFGPSDAIQRLREYTAMRAEDSHK